MGIKRYKILQDTTITNASKPNLLDIATASNMGAADSLEVFKIAGQMTTSSLEKSRILLKFSTTDISTDRTNKTIPNSGSVQFWLRLFNAEHPFTLPQNYTMDVQPISTDWEEGEGLDMDEYDDIDEASWVSASSAAAWTTQGGDFYTDIGYPFTFATGTENLEVNITGLVEGIIKSEKNNYGVCVKLSGSYETSNTTYYTKKFFSRSSEYVLKRPIVEARWDSSISDDRGNFYASSSLMTSADNLNTIYFYNFARGQLKNIPDLGNGLINVKIYDSRTDPGTGALIAPTPTNPVTGGYAGTTGIYSASFALTTTASVVYDRWFTGSTIFYTGAIEVKQEGEYSGYNTTPRYIVNILNMKDSYLLDERARFRIFTRTTPQVSNYYTVASTQIMPNIIKDLHFKLLRTVDNEEVIGYDTGSSVLCTKCSYDVSGSYFDMDMDFLYPGYMYSLKFAFKRPDGKFEELNETFRFRIHKKDWE